MKALKRGYYAAKNAFNGREQEWFSKTAFFNEALRFNEAKWRNAANFSPQI